MSCVLVQFFKYECCCRWMFFMPLMERVCCERHKNLFWANRLQLFHFPYLLGVIHTLSDCKIWQDRYSHCSALERSTTWGLLNCCHNIATINSLLMQSRMKSRNFCDNIVSYISVHNSKYDKINIKFILKP